MDQHGRMTFIFGDFKPYLGCVWRFADLPLAGDRPKRWCQRRVELRQRDFGMRFQRWTRRLPELVFNSHCRGILFGNHREDLLLNRAITTLVRHFFCREIFGFSRSEPRSRGGGAMGRRQRANLNLDPDSPDTYRYTDYQFLCLELISFTPSLLFLWRSAPTSFDSPPVW